MRKTPYPTPPPGVASTASVITLLCSAGFLPVTLGQEALKRRAYRQETPLPSVEDISGAIDSGRKEIRSLRLVVRRKTTVSEGRTFDPPRDEGEVEFAFDGDLRYLREKRPLRHVRREYLEAGRVRQLALSPEEIERRFGKYFTFTRVCDGAQFRSLRGNIGEIHSMQAVRLSKSSNFDFYYLRCVGWFIRDPTAGEDFENQRRRACLPWRLKRPGAAYNVGQDSVDGMNCIRLDGYFRSNHVDNLDTIWLSCSHNYMMVRRQMVDKRGRLILEYLAGQPTKVAPHLWLPKKLRARYYAGDSSGSNKLLGDTELELMEWQANDVNPSLFKLKFPPGAAVADFAESERKGLPPSSTAIRMPSVTSAALEKTVTTIQSRSRRKYLMVVGTLPILLVAVGLIVRKWLARHGVTSR